MAAAGAQLNGSAADCTTECGSCMLQLRSIIMLLHP